MTNTYPEKPLRIVLLHGYALHGSGSNVYVNEMSKHLATLGHEVHVVCQDRSWPPDPHIARVTCYDADGRVRDSQTTGHIDASVHLHRPELGPVLPVYNWDRYPGFDRVEAFPDLSDEQVERYIENHANALRAVIEAYAIQVIHANHVVAMPEVARRATRGTTLPFFVMPHGSAIEYVVRKDERFKRLAAQGLKDCAGLIIGGDEMLTRIDEIWGSGFGHRKKAHAIPTGVDLRTFRQRAEGEVVDYSVLQKIDESHAGPFNDAGLALELADQAQSAASDEELVETVERHRYRYNQHAPDGDAEQKLRNLGFEENEVIFFGGKLVAGKGVHKLLVAMIDVVHQRPKTRLVLVGQGTFREALQLLVVAIERSDRTLFERIVRLGWRFDGKQEEPLSELFHLVDAEAFADLHRRACLVDLSSRICFTGFLPHDGLAMLLRHSAVSVLPSSVPEAYPLSLVESLASGLFPVVADHGGARFFVDDLVRKTDLPRDILAAAAESRVSTPALATTLIKRLEHHRAPSSKAREIATERFGWRSLAQRAAALYRQTLAKN